MFITCLRSSPPNPFPLKTFSNKINQKSKPSLRLDQRRAFGPYSLVFLSLPSYKSRNFEDEPVALHPFHSPIKTVPTRVSLRGWLGAAERGGQCMAPSKEEKTHRAPALCLPPSNLKEKPILFPSRGLQGAKLISFSH